MKRSYFIALSCMLLFAACSDSNEGGLSKGPSKVYREPDLAMTLNGEEVSGKSVLFTTNDLLLTDIALYNVIPGEDTLRFEAVELTPGSSDVYTFSATSTTTDRVVSFEGTLNTTLHIDVTYTATSPVVAQWALDASEGKPLSFEIDLSDPDELINLYGFWGYDTVSSSEFDGVMGGVVTFMLLVLDFSFDFNSTGEFAASWSSKMPALIPIEAGTTADGLIRYNVNGDNLYLSVGIDQMLSALKISELTSSSLISELEISSDEALVLLNLLQKLYKGLPLHQQTLNDGANLYLSVDREMMLPYIDLIAKLLEAALADVDLGDTASQLGITNTFLTNFPSEFARIVKESNSFKMEFRLRYTADTTRSGEAISESQFMEMFNAQKQ